MLPLTMRFGVSASATSKVVRTRDDCDNLSPCS